MTNNMANNKGFTLIEIIIVIIVLGILSVFGFHFISTGIHTYSMMEKQKGLFDQATMVMERISRELRDATPDTDSITISSPTSGNTSSTLTFTKSHGTGQDSDTEDISFQLDGSTLKRVGTATVNLADNVSTFDVTRVTPTPPPDREEITITLTLETGEASITLQSYICPKNLACEAYKVGGVTVGRKGRNFGGHWKEDIE